MSEKIWIEDELELSGFKYPVRYNQETVENLFVPFLKTLGQLRTDLDRKIICYLAAPPCTGKTALSMYLEKLSRERKDVDPIRAVSMDGFHFSNAYLDSHLAMRDGSTIPMKFIKGAPETFDTDLMQQKLRAVRGEGADFPIYDRNIHDVIPDAMSVDDDIILLEGNYLLLKNPKWTNIRALADYSLFIKAEPELLKDRLIERKLHGGKTQTEAEKFFNQSDVSNINLVTNNSVGADETWHLTADGDYELVERRED